MPEKVYEVMVDTWGADDIYHRGDLLREGDCKYDLKEALARGVLRLAPEYAGTGIASTTMPLNPDGSIDWSVQDAARASAGVLSPEDQHEANKRALDAAQAAYDASERTLKEGRLGDAEEERRKRLDAATTPHKPEPVAAPEHRQMTVEPTAAPMESRRTGRS